MTKNSVPGGSAPGLQRNAVGLVPVLFQSVANMAPGAAVAFSILFAAPYAGGATPLAVLIGLGLCLLVAVTIGQMAKHLPSAGGLYTYNTYNARGLGTGFGFMVGWAFLLAEVVVAPGGLLILGIVASPPSPGRMPPRSLPRASVTRWAGSACFPVSWLGSTRDSGHLGSLPTCRCCWPSAMRWASASLLAHR